MQDAHDPIVGDFPFKKFANQGMYVCTDRLHVVLRRGESQTKHNEFDHENASGLTLYVSLIEDSYNQRVTPEAHLQLMR